MYLLQTSHNIHKYALNLYIHQNMKKHASQKNYQYVKQRWELTCHSKQREYNDPLHNLSQ